jgi:hypothetical protein
VLELFLECIDFFVPDDNVRAEIDVPQPVNEDRNTGLPPRDLPIAVLVSTNSQSALPTVDNLVASVNSSDIVAEAETETSAPDNSISPPASVAVAANEDFLQLNSATEHENQHTQHDAQVQNYLFMTPVAHDHHDYENDDGHDHQMTRADHPDDDDENVDYFSTPVDDEYRNSLEFISRDRSVTAEEEMFNRLKRSYAPVKKHLGSSMTSTLKPASSTLSLMSKSSMNNNASKSTVMKWVGKTANERLYMSAAVSEEKKRRVRVYEKAQIEKEMNESQYTLKNNRYGEPSIFLLPFFAT